MITFKQFLEAREVKDIQDNEIRNILRHINDPIIGIKFALYCAEDCFQFNNEQTRGPAQRCIDLVKKWLKDPESVTNQELRSTVDAASDAAARTAASTVSTRAAAWSVCATGQAAICFTANSNNRSSAIINVIFNLSTAASTAAANAFHAANPERNEIFNQKRQEYTRKLKGMTTTRSGSPTSIEPLKGYDNTHLSIMAALDSLEEIGEIGKEHFVYQDDDGQWVFDLGHDNILRADSREKLAELIHNDRYYLNALMRLYNANV